MTISSTMLLSDLLRNICTVEPTWDRHVCGLTLDSRHVQAGDVFVACAGEKTHGRDYIHAAIAQGAVAVLQETTAANVSAVLGGPTQTFPIISIPQLSEKIGFIAQQFYHHPSQQLSVIGVTGTNGKTSCTQFIANALTLAQKPCGVVGTLGNGLVGQLAQTTHTTPDAITVQKLLASLQQQGAQAVAMEVSSHGLAQGRVNGVQFAVAVFTNLTRDHLDYHGDMASYARAKKRLFESDRTQCAVINADDAWGRELLAELSAKLPVIGYTTNSISPDLKGLPFVSANSIMLGHHGIRADVHTPWGSGSLRSCLLGRFNLSNLLAVLATLGALNIPLTDALTYLEQLRGVPGRMETLGGGTQPVVVVDYAHTPDALEQVLRALQEHRTGKLWCVFGCGGDRDRGKRPLMGAIAERYADHVVITDDNPRGEIPAHIVADIRQGMSANTSAVIEHDRQRAIAHALACAQAGDIVLIAGKGHELYQHIGTEKLPFSGVLTVKLLLENAESL